jgi:CubicO group peptidase (beta-lactamase class C family)
MSNMIDPGRGTRVLFLAFVVAACGAPSVAQTTQPLSDVTASQTAASPATANPATASPATASPAAPLYALGRFPEFPAGALPPSTTEALQAVLDAAVGQGTFDGVTAAVILAGRGSWTGTGGSWDGVPLTPDSRHPTHSAGKTIVAAQTLRLVEDGKLALDAPASDYLPPELEFFDANGATIRQVLAMRSGIPTIKGDQYYLAELAPTVEDVFRMLPEPAAPPDSRTEYAGPNYVLLGSIIEHVTGRPLAEVLRSGVLANPALDGLVYTADGAFASDGWGVETTSAALARWGYELYGGFALSESSLREMTSFEGQWYGLGVMDFSGQYGTRAVGHQGLSSATSCCSAVALVALPEEGVVIAVQADSVGTDPSIDLNGQVDRLARVLSDAARAPTSAAEYPTGNRIPEGDLPIGRHSLTVGGVPVSFGVSTPGWERFGSISLNKSSQGPQAAEGIIYWTGFPDGAHADQCGNLRSAAVGASAEELASVVANAPGTELVTGPAEGSVGGHVATYVEITVREDLGCDPGYFYSWEDAPVGALWPTTNAGDVIRTWIVEFGDTRLFIAGVTKGGSRPVLGEQMRDIVDSIQFE